MKKHFDKVWITSHGDVLKLNTSNQSALYYHKHYNVDFEVDLATGIATVTGDRAGYHLNFRENLTDVSLYKEQYIKDYKFFPWSKPRKVIKDGWIELKETKRVTYTTTQFLLTEEV